MTAAVTGQERRPARSILDGILPPMAIGESGAGAVYCELEELVLRVNDHPEVRLKLLTEVSRALEDCSRLMPAERETLAEKVERWRYQLLNHNAGHLSDDQSELTQRLDLLMNQLSGSEPRPPRSLPSILATTRSQPLSDEIEACLDPRRPLQAVEDAARAVTDRHFAAGDVSASRPMLLYAPLYVSNHCINHCLYCGFRYPNPMDREQLDVAQAIAEADVLGRRGFRHLLVVAGEYPRLITVEYLARVVSALTGRGFAVAIEVAPQSTLGYSQLRAAGTVGVTLYQETYDAERYSIYHPKGTKAWYDWRLEGPERRRGGHPADRPGHPARPGRSARGAWRSDCPRPVPARAVPRPEALVQSAPDPRRPRFVLGAASRGRRDVHPALLRSPPGDPMRQPRALDPRAGPPAKSPGPNLHHPDERRQLHVARGISAARSRRRQP